MVFRVTTDVGYVTKMADTLWLAERTARFGGEAKHCGSLPEGIDFIRTAVATALKCDRTTELELEQYVLSYSSNVVPHDGP